MWVYIPNSYIGLSLHGFLSKKRYLALWDQSRFKYCRVLGHGRTHVAYMFHSGIRYCRSFPQQSHHCNLHAVLGPRLPLLEKGRRTPFNFTSLGEVVFCLASTQHDLWTDRLALGRQACTFGAHQGIFSFASKHPSVASLGFMSSGDRVKAETRVLARARFCMAFRLGRTTAVLPIHTWTAKRNSRSWDLEDTGSNTKDTCRIGMNWSPPQIRHCGPPWSMWKSAWTTSSGLSHFVIRGTLKQRFVFVITRSLQLPIGRRIGGSSHIRVRTLPGIGLCQKKLKLFKALSSQLDLTLDQGALDSFLIRPDF